MLLLLELLLGKSPSIRKYYMWGGREAAKSVSLHIFTMWCFLWNIDITIHAVRHLKGTVATTVWADIYNIIVANEWTEHFEINKSQGTIKKKGSRTEYRAIGLHSQQSDTVPLKANYQLQTKYALVILEEADQIRDKDRDGLEYAIRGLKLKGKNIIWMELFNPSSPLIRIVNWLEGQLPFDYNKAITTGSYMRIKGNTLFHRTNWRCNPYVNKDEAKIAKYAALKERSPHLWKNWDLGMMGSPEGMVFADEIKYLIYEPLDPDFHRFDKMFGGIDFGIRKSAFACVVLGMKRNDPRIYVIDEFYWDNRQQGGKSHDVITVRCLRFLDEIFQKYHYNKTPYISCDREDLSWINSFNEKAKQQGVRAVFVECYKYPIGQAVSIIQNKMGDEGFVFNYTNNKNTLYNLNMELQTLAWKENVATPTLKDTQNHTFDAFRYGCYPHIEYKIKEKEDQWASLAV